MPHRTQPTFDQLAAALALAERRLSRSEKAREAAEAMLEMRSRALAKLNSDLRLREVDLQRKLERDTRHLLAAQEAANVATFHIEYRPDEDSDHLIESSFVGSRNLSDIVGTRQDISTLAQITGLIHPLENSDTLDFFAASADDHGTVTDDNRDMRFRDQRGETRWLRWNIRRCPIPDGEGQLLYGAVRNITEERKTERQRRALLAVGARRATQLNRLSTRLRSMTEARQRDASFLRMILATIPQGVAVFDEEWRLVTWNQRFAEIYGIDESLLYHGMDSADLFFRQYGDMTLPLDETPPPSALLRPGLALSAGSFVEQMDDGRSIGISVVERPGGGIIRTYTDITNHIAVQDQLRDRGEQLAARISELESVGISLEEARNRAVRADQSKSRFLAMMSHDIRTPMNAILALLELLADTALDNEQRRLIDLVRTSGDQMLFLLADIIEVARSDGWSIDLDEQAVPIHGLVTTVADSWRQLARNAGLELTLTIADDLPDRVRADPTRLRQLLDNLISNAIKYTPSGSVHIDCGVTRLTETPNIHIAVTDTGRGIPLEQQANLFKDLRRLQSPLDAEVEGTGLGLAICRRIIDAMHGQMGVESHPGAGSTFWVMIPCHAVDTPLPVRATGHKSDPAPLLIDGRPLHLLVAEDVETNRIVIAAMLDKLGCTYQVVEDGLAAIEALPTARFDAVLMDVSMPRMDGIAATRQIRAVAPPLRDIPIIGVTAFAAEDERISLLSAGMNALVTKPLNLKALAAQLRMVCNGTFVSSALPIVASVPMPDFAAISVIDENALRAQINAVPDAVRARLTDTIITDLETWAMRFATACTASDQPEIARAHHAVKGLSAGFGATALLQECDTLRQQPGDVTDADLVRLKSTLVATIEAIRNVADQPDRRRHAA